MHHRASACPTSYSSRDYLHSRHRCVFIQQGECGRQQTARSQHEPAGGRDRSRDEHNIGDEQWKGYPCCGAQGAQLLRADVDLRPFTYWIQLVSEFIWCRWLLALIQFTKFAAAYTATTTRRKQLADVMDTAPSWPTSSRRNSQSNASTRRTERSLPR